MFPREIERVHTHVVGLDERIGGGIPRGFTVLVAGPSGSMKSTLTMSILYNCAKRDNLKAMYITFEQREEDVKNQMATLGMDVSGVENLNIVDLVTFRKEIADEEEHMDWLGAFLTLTRRYRDEEGCDLLAMDSLDALYSLAELSNPRRTLFHFLTGLKELGITTFLISEMPRGARSFGKYDVEEFIADAIFHLTVRETDMGQTTSIRRYFGIPKMRMTNHSTDYYPFLIIDNSFELITD